MLKLLDITKEYIVEKESTLALRGVSIEFRKNEFVSILGPSGCGKTTLLNIIGGLDRYTGGDIQIDGISTKQYDDVDWDTYRNRKIGFVFQSYNLIPHMNILKNVAMSLTIAGVEREEARARSLEALRKVGLESQARKRPNQLSGGQMQRVAIARALVNNPDIILADEPTGALDSESGIQVMDLLKEVAEDRLVIMVTHNPMLAEEYSTRIVYLKDGEVEGDTMPYDSSQELAKDDTDDSGSTGLEDIELEEVVEEQGESIAVADASVKNGGADAKPLKAKERHERLKNKLNKMRQADKISMKLSTAISLSWTNLLSKKGRTLLTSIAGSIGIIGIILVLSLSTGARAYINGLEESALSTYPLTVSKSNLEMSAILNSFMQATEGDGKFDENVVTTQQILGQILPDFLKGDLLKKNDLSAFKTYIDNNFDAKYAVVKYNYGTTFNAFATDPKDPNNYMKVNPYTEMMDTVVDQILEAFPDLDLDDASINIFGEEMDFNQMLAYMATKIGAPWDEMSDNQELLDSQYDLVGNQSRWPQKANEVVIVVNENNTLFDYQLFMLGLKSTSEVPEAIGGGTAFVETTFSVDSLIGRQFKIMTNADYLEELGETEDGQTTWKLHDRKDLDIGYVDEHAMTFADRTDTVKVVGVVRPKKGVVATSINGVIGYTSALTEAMFAHAANHPAIKATEALRKAEDEVGGTYYKSIIQFSYFDGKNLKTINVGDDMTFWIKDQIDTPHSDYMRQLGVVDTNYPESIDFYCLSFDSKDEIVKFIAQYEEDTGNALKYSDSLSSMMSFVNTMADTLTGVLIAFAAISLIVSTIMIAIIIYTSVLERRKEIGVLRSIGARKKDISRVFIAESAILGGYSGIIGVFVSFIISLIGSAILSAVFNINGLMKVTWWHCLMMFVISVLLSMFAGFIPSRIAANKDPAIALRSE